MVTGGRNEISRGHQAFQWSSLLPVSLVVVSPLFQCRQRDQPKVRALYLEKTMSLLVSLKALVAEMDVPSDQFHAYLNKHTGELVTISEEEIDIIESGDSIEDCPQWQQEA